MHHAGMDMDHGHMGHGDMDMGGKCNMNVINTNQHGYIFPLYPIPS